MLNMMPFGNSSHNMFDVEAPQVGEAASESAASLLSRLLCSSCFSTLVMAVSLFIYKPPHGILFEHHVLAYYIALAFISIAGVVVFWAAYWVAEGESQQGHRRAFGMAVLLVSVIPLAAVGGLGGYAVLVKASNQN